MTCKINFSLPKWTQSGGRFTLHCPRFLQGPGRESQKNDSNPDQQRSEIGKVSKGKEEIMKKYLSAILCLVCLIFGGLACTESPTASVPDTPGITVASITVTSTRSTILIGQTEQMTATITMSDGSTKPGDGTWGSANTNTATVNQSGLVTGFGVGSVTIYHQSGGKQGSKLLTVNRN